MSQNPFLPGCSPAQTFPFYFHVRGGMYGPRPRRRAGAPRSSSANLTNGNITGGPFHSKELSFFSKKQRAYRTRKRTGCGVHPPVFRAGNAGTAGGNGLRKGNREAPSKTHIRRTKRVRYKEDGTTYRSGNIPERTETGGRTTVQGPRRFCRKRKKPLLFSGFSL